MPDASTFTISRSISYPRLGRRTLRRTFKTSKGAVKWLNRGRCRESPEPLPYHQCPSRLPAVGPPRQRPRSPASRPLRTRPRPLGLTQSTPRPNRDATQHAQDHQDHRLHDRRAFRRRQGEGPRLVSRARPSRRVARLHFRQLRDHLPDHWRHPQHPPRSSLRRRNPGRTRYLVPGSGRKAMAPATKANTAMRPAQQRPCAPRPQRHRIAQHPRRPAARATSKQLAAPRNLPTLRPLQPRELHEDRGRARQPDLAASDRRGRGHRHRGPPRSRPLALHAASGRIRG